MSNRDQLRTSAGTREALRRAWQAQCAAARTARASGDANGSLVVTSTGSGEADDRQLQETVRTGTKTVAVGLLDSQHFDLTDAAAIGGLLRTAEIPFELGTIGAVATSNTSAIVQRFLDAALNDEPHVPTDATLLDGLPSTTDHAFASGS